MNMTSADIVATPAPEAHTPDWVKDAIFYQIFPDRFAKSETVDKPGNLEPWDSAPTTDGFKGGDLAGVMEHLDYLVDLGITAIYFNPIFQSAANHRYHTHDYLQVDPILGGNAVFKQMLDAAHQRGIKVVLDGVFNHASRGFFQFNHILELGGASPYIDWFTVKGWPMHAYEGKPNYVCWWNLAALPKFNTNTTAVRKFLWGVGRYWMEQGIDGWRLDVPEEIDDDGFWREFRRQVKEVNPEAYICGEIWHAAQRWLRGDQFDSVMNYLFTRACLNFFPSSLDREQVRKTPNLKLHQYKAQSFAKDIDTLLALYSPQITQAQLNLLDSHDMPRFLTLANEDESALRLATLYQMTYPGAPCIYYGDEIGMSGKHDPDCRRAFPWDESKWNVGLRDYFKRCIALRKTHSALRRGEYINLYANGNVYAFARRDEHETLIIALNTADHAAKVDLSVGKLLPKGAILREVWSSEQVTVSGDKLKDLHIPARDGLVLQVI